MCVYWIEYVIRWLFLDYKEKSLDMYFSSYFFFLVYYCYFHIISLIFLSLLLIYEFISWCVSHLKFIALLFRLQDERGSLILCRSKILSVWAFLVSWSLLHGINLFSFYLSLLASHCIFNIVRFLSTTNVSHHCLTMSIIWLFLLVLEFTNLSKF